MYTPIADMSGDHVCNDFQRLLLQARFECGDSTDRRFEVDESVICQLGEVVVMKRDTDLSNVVRSLAFAFDDGQCQIFNIDGSRMVFEDLQQESAPIRCEKPMAVRLTECGPLEFLRRWLVR